MLLSLCLHFLTDIDSVLNEHVVKMKLLHTVRANIL